MRRLVAFTALAASLSLTSLARAESIVAPQGAGQSALAVIASESGVKARVCPASAGCSGEQGDPVGSPPAAFATTGHVTLASIELANGKHVVRVDLEGKTPGEAWVALVAASGAAPALIWEGVVGASKGEQGEGRTKVVIEEKLDRGVRLVIGDRFENATICGRPTVLGARELDPSSLALVKGATVQSLSADERAKATKIHATRIEAEKPIAAAPLLRATTASSAVDKKMAALTDGDVETTWSEDRTGVGRGEFVSMSSASEVGVTWLELHVRPAKADVPGGAAPKRFYLATPDRLFEVTMPEDAWLKAGARYEIRLPEEVRSECVAIVLDEAYVHGDPKSAVVTLAEIAAHSAFDGSSLDALVGALAGGGDRAKAAAALLGRAGKDAVKSVIDGYGKLDDAGKSLARDVVDGAPCSDQVPFFAGLMIPLDAKGKPRALGATDGEAIHARDRIRRCGRAAAPTLAKLIGEANVETQVEAARELAIIAPAEALAPILEAIPKASDRVRRELREALAQAARSERARASIETELEASKFAGRSEITRIDTLRAIGPALASVSGGREAFASLAVAGAPFRTRFLLQAPAADLARSGDAPAAAYLRASLRNDEDAHVRARAAEVAARVPSLGADVAAAIGDADVRVRAAAVAAIGRALAEDPGAGKGASSALMERLAADPWTFVRSGAARTLAAGPADPAIDKALAAALADASPEVRGEAVDALGAHHATVFRDPIHALALAAEQPLDVRARAIVALGAMCDARWLDEWTKLARKLASPGSDADQRLGSAALEALGALHPGDLADRVSPLEAKDAPRGVRELAKLAQRGAGTCR